MSVCLRAKFQVFSITPTSFRRGIILPPFPSPLPTLKRTPKKPTPRLGLIPTLKWVKRLWPLSLIYIFADRLFFTLTVFCVIGIWILFLRQIQQMAKNHKTKPEGKWYEFLSSCTKCWSVGIVAKFQSRFKANFNYFLIPWNHQNYYGFRLNLLNPLVPDVH